MLNQWVMFDVLLGFIFLLYSDASCEVSVKGLSLGRGFNSKLCQEHLLAAIISLNCFCPLAKLKARGHQVLI